MSSNEDRPGREVAHRLFAAEYDDASLSYAESDRERAPNYVITPTGARVNRLFVVGTMTEVTSVNEDMIRARVVDPTGAFVVYAGQYQPDELAAIESLDPPEFVAITGKARTFQPEDSDRVYTSIRPESVATVDADTRDRWVIDAADRTIERIETYAAAAELDARDDALTEALREAGVDESLANGIPLAQPHYGTTPGYLDALRTLSVEAVEVVAGERDQVERFDRQPDATGPSNVTFADLAGDVDFSAASTGTAEPEEPEPETPTEPPIGDSAPAETGTAAATGTATGSATDTEVESGNSFEESADSFEESESAEEPDDAVGVEGSDDAAEEPDDAVEESESLAESEELTDETEASDESEASDDRTATYDEASVEESASEANAEASAATGESANVEETSTAATNGEGTVDETVSLDDSTGGDLGDFDGGDFGDEMYEMDEEERERIESEFGTEFSTGAEVEEPGEADVDVPDDPVEDGSPAPADDTSEPTPGTEPTDAAEPAGGEADGETDDEGVESDEDETDVQETEEPVADAETAADETEASTEAAEASADAADEEGGEPAEDVDVQDLVVETMTELDEGAGADRSAVIESVVEETGLSEAEVEDAIQDALMGGQCYEPDDETLKAI